MDAANTVDWSMGSYAARLADWDTAVDIGRRVSGPGVPVPGVERARMREDMAEIVPRAEELIRGFTDMEVSGFRSRAWVMARCEWIRANLNGLQRLLEPLAERMLDGRPTRAEFKRKALGAQAGALFGYVARKVLGQYDVFLPPDDEGLLYFVGPNIVEVERRFSLPPQRLPAVDRDPRGHPSRAVRLGAVAARVPLRPGGRLPGQHPLDSQAAHGPDAARGRGGAGPASTGAAWAASSCCSSPEQREMFMRMQAMMSLLEGHASFVMNEVARDHVAGRRPDAPGALRAARSRSNLERTLQRAIGFEQKIRQYDTGERFVRDDRRARGDGRPSTWCGGAPTICRRWMRSREPERWLARVGG